MRPRPSPVPAFPGSMGSAGAGAKAPFSTLIPSLSEGEQRLTLRLEGWIPFLLRLLLALKMNSQASMKADPSGKSS